MLLLGYNHPKPLREEGLPRELSQLILAPESVGKEVVLQVFGYWFIWALNTNANTLNCDWKSTECEALTLQQQPLPQELCVAAPCGKPLNCR